MGGALSNLRRVLRTYNVENRAHKALSEDRKVVSPKHKSTVPILEKIKTEYSDKYEELLRKNEDLDKNLKNIYVTSTDKVVQPPKKEELLPKRTFYESPFEYGYEDPEVVPAGRYTLSRVIDILTKHNENPKANPVANLAEQYKIDPTHLENVVKYFKLYQIEMRNYPNKKVVAANAWIPGSSDSTEKPKNLQGPELKNLKKRKKQLPSGTKESEVKT